MTRRAIMVDTETLATATDAAITQIAAVVFDLDTGALDGAGERFNVYIKNGFGSISRSTVMWWMGQKHGSEFAARVEAQGVDLREALMRFTGWLNAVRQPSICPTDCGGIAPGAPLYAHGAPFDFPVLRTSFEACEMVPPWSYRDELDTRAFYKELPDGKPPEVPLPPDYAKHDALSDCLLQIAQLVHARRLLGLVRTQEAAA